MKEEEVVTIQRAMPPLSRSLPSLLDEFDDHVVLKAVRGRRIVGSVRAK